MAKKVNAPEFRELIQNSPLPVLADFYSDGCLPCRRIAPLLSKAEAQYDGKLTFVKVNIAMNEDLVYEYEIEAAPTLLLLRNGKEISRSRGTVAADALNEWINTNIQEEQQ